MKSSRSARYLVQLLVLALLCACSAGPPPAAPRSATAVQAAKAQARGEWAPAAQLWEQAADEQTPTAAAWHVYQLNAADAWSAAGQAARSGTLLVRVDANRLSPLARNRLHLLSAELALGEGDAEKAEFFLDAAARNLDLSLRPRYTEARRRLDDQVSDPANASIVAATDALRGMPDYDPASALAILFELERVPSSRLEELATHQSRLADWARLALSIRHTLVGHGELLDAATAWEASYPGHEVDAAGYLELAWQYGQKFPVPARVAVLLPQSGNLAGAASAIRDGLLASYLDQPSASVIDFIDVGADPVSALMAYTRAADTGYDWVIGPLNRQSVAMIAELDDPPVPVLLLNDPGFPAPEATPGTAPVYSLSLSQTEEARAIARRALANGHRRAIVLAADSLWGDRAQAAFIETFEAGEGEIVAAGRFGRDAESHAVLLADLLEINDSRQRKDSLQAALRTPLEFEPTRRDDFDAIFLAAEPTLGRQLKPQLRFFDAGGKPIFAMSRIFSGQVDSAVDRDLDGVLFATTRHAVDAAHAPDEMRLQSLRGGAFGNLADLGRDAWNVVPWLGLMARDPDLVFPGRVGKLRLGPGGALLREPVWARFERGRPRPESTNGQ